MSSWAEKALLERPNYVQGMRMAAVGHALAGRLASARDAMARMRQLDPELRVSNLKMVVGFLEQTIFPDVWTACEKRHYRNNETISVL
jgi:hypothetical protein